MNKFFTRTKHLDRHIATRLRERARYMRDQNKEMNKLYGYCKDIDSPVMLELSQKFAKYEDSNTMYEWLCNQDTAFRDCVPVQVFDILKEELNRYKNA